MKKWNNPELFSLGVENTFDEYETEETASESSSMQYCHRLKTAINTSSVTGREHPKNNKCHIKDAEGHYWNGAKLSKCCCTDPS